MHIYFSFAYKEQSICGDFHNPILYKKGTLCFSRVVDDDDPDYYGDGGGTSGSGYLSFSYFLLVGWL